PILALSLRRIAIAMAAASIAACASYSGSGLVAGKSTAAEVEQQMGPPRERLQSGAGDTVWFYPRGPFGRETFAVTVAPDGRVRSVEQRLTVANISGITVGKTTSDVRLLMGPPNRVTRNHMGDRDVWEYRMYNQIQVPYNLYVQYSLDGKV